MVEKVYHKPGTDIIKLRLAQEAECIGHTIFNVSECGFKEGDVVDVKGWQLRENRYNVLVVTPALDLAMDIKL